MSHVENHGQNDTPDPTGSEARKYSDLGDGARQAREDMTRIMRAVAMIRVDAATCAVLRLDEQGRAMYVGRLRRVQETLVELERTLAYAARYFDEAAAKFEAEGR